MFQLCRVTPIQNFTLLFGLGQTIDTAIAGVVFYRL